MVVSTKTHSRRFTKISFLTEVSSLVVTTIETNEYLSFSSILELKYLNYAEFSSSMKLSRKKEKRS